jgi:hypothetical protein
MGVWRSAQDMLSVLNSLDKGTCARHTKCRRRSNDVGLEAAWKRTHDRVLREASGLERRRRGLPTGAHAVSELLHTEVTSSYSVARPRCTKQVPLIASVLDEPKDSLPVDMLCALFCCRIFFLCL